MTSPKPWFWPESQPWGHDCLTLQNLSFRETHCVGVDAWGRRKEHPIQLSVSLSYRKSFDSAAHGDALDQTTIHYGLLSKALRNLSAASDGWESVESLTGRLHQTIQKFTVAANLVDACQVVVHVPKATLTGSSISFLHFKSSDKQGSARELRTLQFTSLKIPLLIGVNANERLAKQPLTFHIWLQDLPTECSDIYAKVETALLEIVESTRFETLEALVVYVAQALYQRFHESLLASSSIRIRIEKPLAVPFADAPAIEICRTADDLGERSGRLASLNHTARQGLCIVRPYLPKPAGGP